MVTRPICDKNAVLNGVIVCQSVQQEIDFSPFPTLGSNKRMIIIELQYRERLIIGAIMWCFEFLPLVNQLSYPHYRLNEQNGPPNLIQNIAIFFQKTKLYGFSIYILLPTGTIIYLFLSFLNQMFSDEMKLSTII